MKNIVVTIDGPAGTGKSTVAKSVASALGYSFLDSGALYRTCALAVDLKNGDIDNEEECRKIVEESSIKLEGSKVFLNGKDVSDSIRTNRISTLSSKIATHSKVRQSLLDVQRSYAKHSSIVAEGRDTGSAVFPDADIKIFLDASLEERARRRCAELASKGINIPLEQIIKDVTERDYRDKSRATSPLTIPYNAVVVDTTHMTISEVIKELIKIVKENLAD
jgi:cytidylate kinase